MDRSKNVIYLHLESYNDCNDLIELFETKTAEDIELFELFQTEQTKFIRALLLLFSISHIVIVSNPTCSFDISYIRLFRIVDIFRNKLIPPLVELIKTLGLPISKDWLYAARPCAPRVLFTFENCSLDLLNESLADSSNSSSKALEKLQHSLEDHIYQSMRKSYVITNISNNSLFAIPANQEFVYIHRYTHDLNVSNKFLMNSLIQDCLRFKDARLLTSSLHYDFNANIFDFYKADTRLFRKFLFGHVNQALKEGFNDNLGRNNVNPLFELMPSPVVFVKLFDALHDFFLNDQPPKSSKLQSYFNQIKTHVDIDAKYSENRCKKALPLAMKAYNETLPSHFTLSLIHISQGIVR